jgi:hypothetical protein
MTAWRRRQENIHSAKFVWTTRETLTAGCLMSKEEAQMNTVNGVPVLHAIPPQDSHLTYVSTLTIDGAKMRYTDQAEAWSHEKKGFVPHTTDMAFDGDISKQYSSPGPLEFGKGTIHRERSCWAVRLQATEPPVTYCRPLVLAKSHLKPDDYTILTQTGIVEGRVCRILQEIPTQPRQQKLSEWWVDPGRDYIIMRHRLIEKATFRPTCEFTVSYQQLEGGGWKPRGWKIVWSDRQGKMVQSWDAEVNACAINIETKPTEFELPFPEGTLVYDTRTNTEAIVRSDQSLRTIDPSEWGPETTYQKLVATDPRNLPAWRKWVVRLNWAAVLLLGGIILMRFFRKIRHRRDGSGSAS